MKPSGLSKSGSKLVIGFVALTGLLRAASVQIVIESEQGEPIPQAIVSVIRSTADQAPASLVQGVTDSDGRAKLDIPDAGNYAVCASPLEGEFLDSCLWPNATSSLKISASPASSRAVAQQTRVTLQRGTSMKFRVLDPQGLIPTPVNPKRPAFLRAGIWSSSHFYFARLVSFDAAGLNYEVVVPKGVDVHISFQAAGVNISDTAGRAVVPGIDTVSLRTGNDESTQVRIFQASSAK